MVGSGWSWVEVGSRFSNNHLELYPCLEVSVKVSLAFKSLAKYYFWEFHFFSEIIYI